MFSRVYWEPGVADFPLGSRFLKQFSSLPQVPINHYKDIFNRPRQDFLKQKEAPALILAVKRGGPFFYPGRERVNSFQERELWYTDPVRNCAYNCEYCFLKGMHDSAHTLVFVNQEDFIRSVKEDLPRGPKYLSLSYLTDILAYEGIFGLGRFWVEQLRGERDMTLEIRTKSDQFQNLKTQQSDSVILTWSLTPDPIARQVERGCPPVNARLFDARRAQQEGWRVRLCFDPVILGDNWKRDYQQLIQRVFSQLQGDKIEGISFGVFRLGADYYRKDRFDPRILPALGELTKEDQLMTYPATLRREVRDFLTKEIHSFYPKEKLNFVHG